MKAQPGSRDNSSTPSVTSALEGGGGVKARPPPLYSRERGPLPIVEGAGWAPGPVCTGAENPAATGIQSPDRPAPSVSPIACYN
jgi:hypothetical protein